MQNNVLALGDRNDTTTTPETPRGCREQTVGTQSTQKLRCSGAKSIRTMSAGSELCAPFGVASSQAKQRKKKSPSVEPSEQRRWRGSGVLTGRGVGEWGQLKTMQQHIEEEQETNLVLMSRVRKDVRSESVSSGSVQVVVLIDKVLELQLHIRNFVGGKLKLLQRHIRSAQKSQKTNF